MAANRRMATLLALATLAALPGCGTGTPGGSAMTPGQPTFHPSSVDPLALIGHGLGWVDHHGAPLVNDLAAPTSVGFSVATDPPPAKVDLRPLMSPVSDQGDFGSCTAFATVKGMREFLELKAIRDRGGNPATDFVPLSPAYLWFNERSYMGNSYIDTGADMFLAMNMLMDGGTVPESAYPYPTPAQQQDPWFCRYFLPATPSAQVQRLATPYKGGTIQQVTKLSELKASLDAGYPVEFGFLVFDSIVQARDTGLLPVPDLQNDQLMGGHATLAVGYDDARQVIILKNSWGTTFGDQGYLYMPYKYFDMDLGLVADGWTMRP